MLSKVPGKPGADALACAAFGVVSLWVNALAVPIVVTQVGTWLLVVVVALQLFGVAVGAAVRFDACCGVAAVGCILMGTNFVTSGAVVFSIGYGALYRRYLCSVWAPVRAAQYEFFGQIIVSIAAVPVLFTQESYTAIFIGTAFLLVIVALTAVTEMRPPETMGGGTRVVSAYGLVCAGIGAFSLGGVLLIAQDGAGRYSSHQSVAIAVASSLLGAFASAVGSGITRIEPVELFKGGALLAAFVGALSLVIHGVVGYCMMSAAFGSSAALVIINSRAVCFNASSLGYIVLQKVADLAPPLALYAGLSFRQLLLTTPGVLSLALLVLPWQ